MPLDQRPRGDRERVEDEVRDALTGCGFDEAVTFSLVADELAEPLRPGPAVAADPGRALEPEARERPAAEPGAEPAGRPPAQRGARQRRRRAVRDRQRLPAPPRPATCPTSRPGWRWSAAATSSASRGWSRRCSAGSTPDATWRSGPPTVPPFAPGRAAELLLGGDAPGLPRRGRPRRARRPGAAQALRGGRAGPRRADPGAADARPAAPAVAAVPGRRRATSRWSSRGRSPGPSWPAAGHAAAGSTARSGRVPRHLPGRQHSRGQAQRPLRPPVPPPRADPDRRGGRPRGPMRSSTPAPRGSGRRCGREWERRRTEGQKNRRTEECNLTADEDDERR